VNVHRCWPLLAASLLAGAPSQAREPDLHSALREAVHTIAVPAAGANIVVTSYRPQGYGPFPWIVLSHGTAPSREANRALGRYRNPALMREWVKRGYAVLVPIRRGYGASGGERFADERGSCAKPDYKGAGEGAALDLLAAVEWGKSQPDFDAAKWLLVGQSSGGFASIYAASKQPAGLVAVLAFAPGRGGDPDKHPGEPCAPERMAAVFKSIAPKIHVPVLWFYAENDAYIGPAAQRLWYGAFKEGGGRGELVVIAPFPERRGHGVFPSKAGVPLWTPAVTRFIHTRGLPLSL
jgi:dienelactone hydrolase